MPFILLILIFNVLSFFFFRKSIVYMDDAVYAMLLLINNTIILYPVLKDIHQYIRTKRFQITFFSPYAIFSFMVYAYPLHLEESINVYNISDISYFINMAILFSILFYSILWITLYKLSTKYRISTNLNIDLNRVAEKINTYRLLLYFFSFYSLLIIFYPNYNVLNSIGLGQLNLFITYIAQIWIAFTFVNANFFGKIISLVWIAFYFYFAITSTQLGHIIILAFALIYFDFVKNKKIPYIKITVLSIIFLVFAGFKMEIRYAAWKNNLPRSEVWALWQNKILGEFNEASPPGFVDQSSSGRLSHISLLAFVMHQTPEVVDYWNGYTYGLIFSKLIPRFIWESKPIDNIGNQFGRRYGVISEKNYQTSINLPVVVESFINLGWFGLLATFLLALTLFFIQFILVKAKYFSWYIYGVFAFFRLLHLESNFSMVTGTFILLGVFIFFINKLFKF